LLGYLKWNSGIREVGVKHRSQGYGSSSKCSVSAKTLGCVLHMLDFPRDMDHQVNALFLPRH
jgi:hypothetical protein